MDLGFVVGDRLVFQVEKLFQVLVLIVGCIQVGVVFLFLNIGYIVDELCYFIENSGVKLVVCDVVKLGQIEIIGVFVVILNVDGMGSLFEQVKDIDYFDIVVRFGSDLVVFFYIFGIMGCLKGVMLFQDNLLLNV